MNQYPEQSNPEIGQNQKELDLLDDRWLRAVADTEPHVLDEAISDAILTARQSKNPSVPEVNDYFDALMTDGYRKRYGFKARVATWVAGLVLITGMGATIDSIDVTAESKLLNNNKELTEEVFKVSSALAVGIAFGALIGPISDEASNRSAKRRAKK